MAKVKKIIAREILDARGMPTIGAMMCLDSGDCVDVEVSSGHSIGAYEPVCLRDGDPLRFNGMGALKAVEHINSLIGPKLIGVDVSRLHDVDYWLISADNTENRSKLGANTITAVSQLFLKAGAVASKLSPYRYVQSYYNEHYKSNLKIEKVPSPIVNVINGGRHGYGTLDFQEFHVIPQTANTFAQSVELATRLYEAVRKVLEYRNVGTFLSEQGGFSPKLRANLDGLEVIKEAAQKEKIRLGVDLFLGLDCAASFYYKDSKYRIKDREDPIDEATYIQFLVEAIKNYSILVVEDPLYEDSFQGWKKITDEIGQSTYVAGDDLVTGSKKRLEKALNSGYCNSALIKFSQYSTVSEMFEAIVLLKSSGSKIIVSQRFGETNDTLIADLAVGIQADFVKFGSINRGERVAKYNRLLAIQHEIGLGGTY